MVVQYIKKNDEVVEAKLLKVEKKDLKKGCQITIPEGITVIGSHAFDLFRAEKIDLKIKMPDTVVKLEEMAFKSLTIAKIKFSKNLEEMENCAFESTIFKGKVFLPEYLKKISARCFGECDFLERIQLPRYLKVLEDQAFIKAKFQNKVVIPQGVKIIPDSCFIAASFQEGIELPSKLEKIENYAFMDTNIKSVKIPDSVKSIGEVVFASSTISNIKLSKNITSIPYRCFEKTKSLSSIQIPKKVKHIKNCAFAESGLTSIQLEEGLQTLGNWSFSETHLETMNLPQTVQLIGGGCFSECLDLKEVTFPESLKEIGVSAFSNCGLTEVTLPKYVNIGNFAFSNNFISTLSISQDEFYQLKSKYNHPFCNNESLKEVDVYNWKYKAQSKILSKRRVKRIGKERR